MTTITFDQVLDLATKLTPVDQARLVARLAPSIERALGDLAQPTGEDPWDTLARIGDQLSAQGPLRQSTVDELSASRR